MTDAPVDPQVPLSVYAASTETDPQPPSRTLDVVRARRFTGELVFRTHPVTCVYCDDGVVYFAEHLGGPTVADRLRDAGVVDEAQLERGVVHVGDVEHMGRLFDRDDTIDRDAVMVVVETTTDALVSELASAGPTVVDIDAYRHHPSGLHRWFTPPHHDGHVTARAIEHSTSTWTGSTGSSATADFGSPEVRIEWDLPLTSLRSERVDAAFVDSIDLDEASRAFPDSPPVADAPTTTSDDSDAASTAWPSDFQIVWPDGTHESAGPGTTLDRPAPSSTPRPAPTPDPGLDTRPATTVPHDPLAPAASAPSAPSPAESAHGGGGGVHFDMPTIGAAGDTGAGEPVPDDVAEAVRRALAAIENASVPTSDLSGVDLAPIVAPALRMPTLDLPPPSFPAAPPAPSTADTGEAPTPPTVTTAPERSEWLAAPTPDMLVAADADRRTAAATVPAADGAAADEAPTEEPTVAPTLDQGLRSPEPTSFAPPSSATLAPPSPATVDEAGDAEPSHGPGEARADRADAEPTPVETEATPVEAEHGRASVVFVEDEEPAPGDSRRSALRRLIGSLRRSD